jgi:hypothetical protein
VVARTGYLYYYQQTSLIFEANILETSLPPSPVDANSGPGKRVVAARQASPPPMRRPRLAKRLFLIFCIGFLFIVYLFITGGN